MSFTKNYTTIYQNDFLYNKGTYKLEDKQITPDNKTQPVSWRLILAGYLLPADATLDEYYQALGMVKKEVKGGSGDAEGETGKSILKTPSKELTDWEFFRRHYSINKFLVLPFLFVSFLLHKTAGQVPYLRHTFSHIISFSLMMVYRSLFDFSGRRPWVQMARFTLLLAFIFMPMMHLPIAGAFFTMPLALGTAMYGIVLGALLLGFLLGMGLFLYGEKYSAETAPSNKGFLRLGLFSGAALMMSLVFGLNKINAAPFLLSLQPYLMMNLPMMLGVSLILAAMKVDKGFFIANGRSRVTLVASIMSVIFIALMVSMISPAFFTAEIALFLGLTEVTVLGAQVVLGAFSVFMIPLLIWVLKSVSDKEALFYPKESGSLKAPGHDNAQEIMLERTTSPYENEVLYQLKNASGVGAVQVTSPIYSKPIDQMRGVMLFTLVDEGKGIYKAEHLEPMASSSSHLRFVNGQKYTIANNGKIGLLVAKDPSKQKISSGMNSLAVQDALSPGESKKGSPSDHLSHSSPGSDGSPFEGHGAAGHKGEGGRPRTESRSAPPSPTKNGERSKTESLSRSAPPTPSPVRSRAGSQTGSPVRGEGRMVVPFLLPSNLGGSGSVLSEGGEGDGVKTPVSTADVSWLSTPSRVAGGGTAAAAASSSSSLVPGLPAVGGPSATATDPLSVDEEALGSSASSPSGSEGEGGVFDTTIAML